MVQKVWVITDSSRGFGRQWAEAAVRRGDLVVATTRNSDTLTPLMENPWGHDTSARTRRDSPGSRP